MIGQQIDTKIDAEYADVIRFKEKIKFEEAQVSDACEIICIQQ